MNTATAPQIEYGKQSFREPNFRIREIPVFGDTILSPMAGFSDLPYRSLCRRYGSAMSYTEFVAAGSIIYGKHEKTWKMLSYSESERPVTFQIFDCDEDRIVEAALRIEELGPDIIDLNMGCSVANVSGRGAGAGLLKDPDKIGRIFRRLTRCLSVPVTGKIRLGWDQSSLNYLDVVRVLQDNGASLVAVHARTKAQAYKGQADWEAIARIVEVAEIPVAGNGDAATPEDIARMKAQTGCSAVMVGRGAIGHPWIFRRSRREDVSFSEKVRFIREHFESTLEFYGERLALILIRKHIVKYLKLYPGIKDLYAQLVTVTSVERFHELLEAVGERLAIRVPPPQAAPSSSPANTPRI